MKMKVIGIGLYILALEGSVLFIFKENRGERGVA